MLFHQVKRWMINKNIFSYKGIILSIHFNKLKHYELITFQVTIFYFCIFLGHKETIWPHSICQRNLTPNLLFHNLIIGVGLHTFKVDLCLLLYSQNAVIAGNVEVVG